MKIYEHAKGFILVGKAAEIREKLADYAKEEPLLKDWLAAAKLKG